MDHLKKKFELRITNIWLFRLYLLKNLPLALFAGVKVREVDEEKSTVTVPYKWLSKNPFRSTYFAAQAMAAEMSTGVLGMMAIQRNEKISMLVLNMEAEFVKKASSRIYFTCENGKEIHNAVEQAIATGEGVTVKCKSTGKLIDGAVVSNFWVTWTFKRKK